MAKKIKKKKFKRKQRKIKKEWVEYHVGLYECSCGKRYELRFRICSPTSRMIMEKPIVVEVGNN